MATRRKVLSSFKEGFQQLRQTSSFEEMRDIIKEMVIICEPQEAHTCKPRIAALMRQKHFAEMRSVKGHPTALQDVDTKYKNLAIVLKSLPTLGMQGVPGAVPPTPHHPQAAPQMQGWPEQDRNRQLPVKPGALGFAGTVARAWLQSRKKQIVGLAGAVVGLGGLVWAYNKFYGDKKTRKNPIEGETEKKKIPDFRTKQLESFERTMMQMQKFKALTQISKDPKTSMEDYRDIFTPGSSRKKKTKPSAESKGIDWKKEESSTQRDLEKALKSITDRGHPTKKVGIPLLTTADLGITEPKDKISSKKSRRKNRAKVRENSPKSEETEAVVRSPKVVSPRRARKISISAEPTPGGSRLVPVVKRTKRIQKIRKS